jgi:hypothetical protein
MSKLQAFLVWAAVRRGEDVPESEIVEAEQVLGHPIVAGGAA